MINFRIARSVELAMISNSLGVFEYQTSAYDQPRFVIGDYNECQLSTRSLRRPTTSRRNHR